MPRSLMGAIADTALGGVETAVQRRADNNKPLVTQRVRDLGAQPPDLALVINAKRQAQADQAARDLLAMHMSRLQAMRARSNVVADRNRANQLEFAEGVAPLYGVSVPEVLDRINGRSMAEQAGAVPEAAGAPISGVDQQLLDQKDQDFQRWLMIMNSSRGR